MLNIDVPFIMGVMSTRLNWLAINEADDAE